MGNISKAIITHLLITAVLLLNLEAQAAVKEVGSIASLQTALSAAQPGDAIIVNDGVYTGNFTMIGNASASSPIILRAMHPGKAVFQKSHLKITGKYWVIEGLSFENSAGGESTILISGGSNNVIRHSKFTGGSARAQISIINGASKNTIEQSTFENETTYHSITVDNSSDTIIRYNRFLGRRSGSIVFAGNGGDAPRTIFEHNYVANGHDYQYGEMLGIKSNDFVARENYFTNNQNGGIVLRYLNRARIECNMFINNRGLSILGDGHIIRNNYFEGNNNGTLDHYPTFRLMSGDWVIGQEHKMAVVPNTGWHQAATNATIENNTIVNWMIGELSIGDGYNRTEFVAALNRSFTYSYAPVNAKISNNLFYDPSDSAKSIQIVASPGAVWSNNIVFTGNTGDLPLSGVSKANPQMQRAADGTLRSAAFPTVGYQGCNVPRNPSDVGASWTGGPSSIPTPSPDTSPPLRLRMLELR